MLRVLVVDDTALFRQIIEEAFQSIPGVTVVGKAHNGKVALEMIESLKPDLVSLDIEMPEMNGVQVLEKLQHVRQRADALVSGVSVPGVLVLSALTQKGGMLTMKALELGAFDFVTKPNLGSADANKVWLCEELAKRVAAFSRRKEVEGFLVKTPSAPQPPKISIEAKDLATPEVVVVGVSTGGPTALATLLGGLPADFPLPILIVQHMPPLFTRSLAQSLSRKCSLQIKEAEEGERVKPSTAYLAPGGAHLKLKKDASGLFLQITDDPPENHCRPSVDYLFRSVSQSVPGRALAVILTGMGNDGTLGLRLLKRHGCRVIAQDEASCVVFGMPKEAILAGVVDHVLGLDLIAGELLRVVNLNPA